MTVGRDDAHREARTLFLEQLPMIERAIRFACRRADLRREDAEDFGSGVMLKLIEDDYAVIARHDRGSSFAAYISVVIQRLLLDYRIAQWGKWHASAAAKRLGEEAVTIEAMLLRDGRSIEEVLPILLRRWPHLTRQRIEAIAGQLPARSPRPRQVDLAFAAEVVSGAEEGLRLAVDRISLSRKLAEVVRSAMDDLDEHDRLLLRLRFEGDMSIADIARALHVEQKPIYRRVQRALAAMRGRLHAVGIRRDDVEEMLAFRGEDLDFAFDVGLPSQSDEEHL